MPTDNGQVPFGALQGGFTKEESLVFIGRLAHNGATLIGAVMCLLYFRTFIFSVILI